MKLIESLRILPLFLLMACGESEPVLKPHPPAQAIRKCDALIPPQSGDTWEGYLTYVMDEHTDCRMRHNALVDFFRLLLTAE